MPEEKKVEKLSSIIKEISYDEADQKLVITFTNNQKYKYDKVPQKIIDEWKKSDSQGKYFIKEIKGKFDCIKLYP
mgnify:CR=1 FL=1